MKTKKQPKLGSKAHQDIKFKEQIEVLNDIVNTRIGVSDIEGVGVFAMKDFKKGDRLYINIAPSMFDLPYKKFNKLDKHVSETIIQHFPMKVTEEEQTDKEKEKQGKASTFWYPVNNMQAYLNHSDKANYDPQTDKALKSIKTGEEITENYKDIKGWEKIYKFLK